MKHIPWLKLNHYSSLMSCATASPSRPSTRLNAAREFSALVCKMAVPPCDDQLLEHGIQKAQGIGSWWGGRVSEWVSEWVGLEKNEMHGENDLGDATHPPTHSPTLPPHERTCRSGHGRQSKWCAAHIERNNISCIHHIGMHISHMNVCLVCDCMLNVGGRLHRQATMNYKRQQHNRGKGPGDTDRTHTMMGRWRPI